MSEMTTKDACELITPVILAGGSGTRLWPLSSNAKPKQFQQIAGQQSMFQQTLRRIADQNRFSAPVIIANGEHRALIEADLGESGITPAAIVLEPEGRNTAPAVALAGLVCKACNLGRQMLIMPSDHYIRDPQALIRAIDVANKAAAAGAFVTFGISPHGPETCYGYIQKGDVFSSAAGPDVFAVNRFVEKPPHHEALKMLETGGYFWNSGMFLFPVDEVLDEFATLEADILLACQEALIEAKVEGRYVAPDGAAFARARNISIDYAIMEKTKRAAVVPVDPLWSDVGSWTAVWQISQQDAEQNVTVGDVLLHDVKGAYVRSEGPVTAVVGLSDVIVVNTGDAVIVAAKSHAQDIRKIAEAVSQREAPRRSPDDGEAAGARQEHILRPVEQALKAAG